MIGAWTPVLSGRDAGRAVEVAQEVARRLRDPERLAAAIAEAGSHWQFDAWSPWSLAQGHPGLAVMFAQFDRCFPGEGWDDAAHAHVAHSVEALKAAKGLPAALMEGIAGIGFAASYVDDGRYARLLETLDGLVLRHATATAARMDGRAAGNAEEDYDAISGLAGLGSYAIERGHEPLAELVMERLVRLLGDGDPPPWHTPGELMDPWGKERYPLGRLNCGMAHGLPGPLSALALLAQAEVRMEGLEAALRRGVAWQLDQASRDGYGPIWPACIPLDPAAAREGPSGASWCYGNPGVAVALWHAGGALPDAALRAMAAEAMRAMAARPRSAWGLRSPTLCHGLGGFAHMLARLGNASGDAGLRAAAASLAMEVADRFELGTLLGFRDLNLEGEPVDQPGLLTGACGVALVLLAAGTAEPPHWDMTLLLS